MKPLFVILLLFTSLSSRAEYVAVPLYQMILTADEIVYGEIIALDSTSYQFKIEGETVEDREVITVRRFEDWACASRWTKYAVGQKLLLFLVEHDGAYVTMSAGNEGELPILGDHIYLHRFSSPILPRIPDSDEGDEDEERALSMKRYPLYGGRFLGYQVSLEQFLKTIETLKNCVEVKTIGNYHRITDASFTCSNEELQVLCEDDLVLETMVIELKERYAD
ncbi:hypothetical protein [Phaeocystidibacter luteus]|uniref:Uncharacterized protein n=1 Tax=Phaeocystidibacter luteus TaxID=911197 RepID=A0A6N6RF56_9FLAO|nr:hypothetical protein [Phaeocystidibacter luteus]KAB2807709.1 hypothetical protein F8C67_11755 [Phaeocystidibacter luteus]